MRQLTDAELGALILVPLVPCLYFGARAAGVAITAWTAYRLAPLAPLIGATVDWKSPYLHGSYAGNKVRVWYVQQNAGERTLNTIQIEVADLPGKHDWRVAFELGWFRQRAEPYIDTRDEALRQRLHDAEVLHAVGAVSSATASYVTVNYDGRRKTLTYVDDITPKTIPSSEAYAMQLELVARLAAIGRQVNAE
jgi:hypothetical protein